jgi:20S proteasome alpha/beta subunit
MSLGINATTPEGQILAADGRQSYRNRKGMTRIGSDSVSKIFKIGQKVGLIVAGLAFLPENGIPKNISQFVEEFRISYDIDDLKIEKIAQKLKDFFEEKYNYKEQLKKLPDQIRADLERQGCKIIEIVEEKDHIKFKFQDPKGLIRDGMGGVDQLQFILSGYDKDGSHKVYMIYVPGKIDLKRDSNEKDKEYGASWIGQIDVVSRIVLGFDGRIGNLPFVQKTIAEIGQENFQKQIRNLEYVIQWGTMTLQDAIDFCKLSIETTTAIQRFSDGIAGDPGDMPGVGGPVDIAVITPKKGFVWVIKKNLKVGEKEIDLDKIDDIDISRDTKKKRSKE